MRDYADLQPAQRDAFKKALHEFIEDLETGTFRPSLRVKRVQGTTKVWEMTWAPDGRATWEKGNEITPGKPHVIWRRIGTHSIFNNP